MKNYLSGILFILITANQHVVLLDSNLDYHLEIEPGVMHVSLSYIPVIADSTTFKYGNEFYGGMKDLLKSLVIS